MFKNLTFDLLFFFHLICMLSNALLKEREGDEVTAIVSQLY